MGEEIRGTFDNTSLVEDDLKIVCLLRIGSGEEVPQGASRSRRARC